MNASKYIFTLLILSAAFQIGYAQTKSTDNKCQIPFELKMEEKGILYVLLEPQYFNSQDLKSLFVCLSQPRSKLAFVKITALSDKQYLERLVKGYRSDLTEAKNGVYTVMSGTPVMPKGVKPIPPPPPNYYRAYYLRYNDEYFQFSPDPQKWEMTTVTLKRKAPRK